MLCTDNNVLDIFMRLYPLLLFIGCVIDAYPPAVSSNGLPNICKKKFACTMLAQGKKCSKNYIQINKWCSNKIRAWHRNKPIRNYCKRSCNTCKRKFSVIWSFVLLLVQNNILSVYNLIDYVFFTDNF